MTMIYDEAILDLGEAGIVTVCLGAAWGPPLPAQKYGYATYYPPVGDTADRLALFARAVGARELRKFLDDEGKRLSGAVASVSGHIKHTYSEISDVFTEMPTGAYALSGGRALLLFCGKAATHLIRIVDVVNNEVRSEETVEALRKRLGVKVPLYMKLAGIQAPIIYSAGEDYVSFSFGAEPVVLSAKEDRLKQESIDAALGCFDILFSKSFLLKQNNERNRLWVIGKTPPYAAHEYISTLTTNAGYQITTAKRSDRIALLHPACVIEIVDSALVRTHLLRPLPRACGKDGSAFTFSPNGRFALIDDAAGTVVIDIDEMRVANVTIPNNYIEINREQFHAIVQYRGATAITDSGGYVLQDQKLTHTPYEKLDWRALAPYDPTTPKPAPSKAFGAFTDSLRFSALALTPTKTKRNSKLYGAPRIASLADWPQHDGKPMLPLCGLDLTDIAPLAMPSPLPTRGALQFYVAVDDEGALLEDDMFNPLAIRVIYAPTLSEIDLELGGATIWPAQYVALTADGSMYPQLDAAIVTSRALSDEDFAPYRDFVAAQMPGGPTAGHRVGGYPHLLQNNDLEARAYALHHGREVETMDDLREAARWRLLLQLDSDDNIMWGTDSGMVYFMIHAADLAAQDFSRVVALTDGC